MGKKRRGTSRYFFAFFGIIIILIGLYAGLRFVFAHWELFTVSNIEIEGTVNIEEDFIMTMSREFIGQNLFSISQDDIDKRLHNIVRIKNAKLSRKLPGTLKLSVTERRGKFYIKADNGSLYPIDEEQIILDNANFYLNETGPIISTTIPEEQISIGKTPQDPFVDLVYDIFSTIDNLDNTFIETISEIYQKDGDICLVENNSGYRVMLEDDNVKEKIRQYLFLSRQRFIDRGYTVDLRFSNQLIIRREDK
jgi:cell division septal protein FtsQ